MESDKNVFRNESYISLYCKTKHEEHVHVDQHRRTLIYRRKSMYLALRQRQKKDGNNEKEATVFHCSRRAPQRYSSIQLIGSIRTKLCDRTCVGGFNKKVKLCVIKCCYLDRGFTIVLIWRGVFELETRVHTYKQINTITTCTRIHIPWQHLRHMRKSYLKQIAPTICYKSELQSSYQQYVSLDASYFTRTHYF